MIYIPTRTPLAWYHYSWEAPLWKPLNVPRTSPGSLTLNNLALAVAGLLKITRQDTALARMTCVSMESRDGRLMVVRGREIMWPWEHGRVRRRDSHSVTTAAAATKGWGERGIGSERERTGIPSLFLSVPSTITQFGNINMPFGINLRSLYY